MFHLQLIILGIVTTRIRGKVSGSIAEVVSVDRKRSKIVIDYASKQDIGWRDDVGKISQDYQVIPNNDYYQNLSYSIKSPITWQEFSSPVNSIVHPAGMKNFADVGISSAAQVGAGDTISTIGIVILDVVGEKRVDVINNFDFGLDNDQDQIELVLSYNLILCNLKTENLQTIQSVELIEF